MPRLETAHKLFIVRRLACEDTPQEVAAAAAATFGVVPSRQQVYNLDPTRDSNAARVAPTLRRAYSETRARYREALECTWIANKAARLGVLQRLSERAEASGDYKLAAKLLEQAAKEVGGWYERHRPGRAERDLAVLLTLKCVSLPAAPEREERHATQRRA